LIVDRIFAIIPLMARKKKDRQKKAISNAFVAFTIGALCSASVPAKGARVVHEPESIPVRVEKLREELAKQATNMVAERNQSGAIIRMQWVNWPNWGNWNNWRNWQNWSDWPNWANWANY
jgi:hypothetical protein